MEETLRAILPGDIERESFAIIRSELAARRPLPPAEVLPVVLRVIHATADFDYAETLAFSPGAVPRLTATFQSGATIVTDTQMALSGINRRALETLGCTVRCFMADADVAREAAARGCTRAAISMEKAAALGKNVVIACGNAPTALLSLCDLLERGDTAFVPRAVIGVPVGFVNVVPAKERLAVCLAARGVPFIISRGRKGGSTVAAAICNALLYEATGRGNG